MDQRVQVSLRDDKIQTAHVGAPVPARPGPLQRAAAWGGSNHTLMLALFGAAAYAMTRFPIATFYNGLGVTPEEVGFGVDDLVRQSVIMLVLIVLGASAVTVSFLVLWFPMMNVMILAERLRATDRRSRARWVLGGGLVGGLVLPFVLLLFLVQISEGLVVALAVAMMVATPQVVRRLPGVPPAWASVRARQRRSRTEFVNLLPVGGVYFLTIALLFGLPVFASSSADAVKAGDSFNSPVLVWRARPAELAWAKDVTRVELSEGCRDLRYLGRTKEAFAVYDVKLRRTHLIPASGATITIVETCKG